MGKLHWKMHYVQKFYFVQYLVNASPPSPVALDLHIPSPRQSHHTIKRSCAKTSPPRNFLSVKISQLCHPISRGWKALSTSGLKRKLSRHSPTRIHNKLKHEKFFPKGPPFGPLKNFVNFVTPYLRDGRHSARPV